MSAHKTKVTYILYQINKALAFEWIIDHINSEKFELSFISIGVKKDSHLEQFCAERNIEFHLVHYESKKDFPKSVYQTYRILATINPEIVHAHIFEGGLIGMVAAKLAGIQKRIYTRHYSTYHHTYARSGVKYDKIINRLATQIIAVSENVKSILIDKERVDPAKIILVHHGFDLSDFYSTSQVRIDRVARKYNTSGRSPVIGVVSRYTHWKGIQYTIPAFKKLLADYPNALLVLCNAKGEYATEIKKMLTELPDGSYREILFEPDNGALFKLFDVFVHVPIDPEIEAFGQIYIEALAAGIPSVFTLSGIACEFIKDGENALVVNFHAPDEIYTAVEQLLRDTSLRNQFIQNGRKDLDALFSLPLMIRNLEKIYCA